MMDLKSCRCKSEFSGFGYPKLY